MYRTAPSPPLAAGRRRGAIAAYWTQRCADTAAGGSKVGRRFAVTVSVKLRNAWSPSVSVATSRYGVRSAASVGVPLMTPPSSAPASGTV